MRLESRETYITFCRELIPMIDAPEFQRWFNQAVHTYSSAKKDYEDEDFGWACFKCQQAAECALKALLRGAGKLGIGHSLLKLTQEIEALDIDVDEIRKCSLTLEKFYIPTRYPDAYPEGSPFEFYDAEEAEKALDSCQTIIEFVKEKYHEKCDTIKDKRKRKSPGKS